MTKASAQKIRTGDRAASKTTETVNPKVAAALGYSSGDDLVAVAKRADLAAGALAHCAYAESVLKGATVADIAVTLGVSTGQAQAAKRAGAFLDRVGPAWAPKVARQALAVSHANADTLKPLTALKGTALADAILNLEEQRAEARRTRAASLASDRAGKAAGGPTKAEGPTEGTASTTAPRSFSDRLKAVEAILSATATAVPRKPTDAQRTTFATVAALVAQIAAEMGTTVTDAAAYGLPQAAA